MISGMPWNGDVKIEVKAPEGVKVLLRLPTSDWMSNLEVRVLSTVHDTIFTFTDCGYL